MSYCFYRSVCFLVCYEKSARLTSPLVGSQTMSIMRGCFKDLPAYQWLTALSQLVSRICHQNEILVQLVKQIIIYVLQVN